jgi:hypothetical protein
VLINTLKIARRGKNHLVSNQPAMIQVDRNANAMVFARLVKTIFMYPISGGGD